MGWNKTDRSAGSEALIARWQDMEKLRGENAKKGQRLRLGLFLFLIVELIALMLLRWRLPFCLGALALGAAAALFVDRKVRALTEENDRLADEMDALAERIQAARPYVPKGQVPGPGDPFSR